MNNKFFNTASDMVKRFRLERFLIVVLASVLLLVTTACSPGSPSVSGTGEYHERVGQPDGIREYTDRADSKSRPDLSSYSDNDARNNAAARAKADELSNRAAQNIKKVRDPGDLANEIKAGTPIQDRVRNFTDDVGDAAGQFKEDFVQGARENTRDLRSNTDKAGRNIQRNANDAQRNAQRATENATDAVRGRA